MSMSNTPDSPAEKPDHRTDQGGNFWTLFTPGIWKVLHAVLQSRRGPGPGWRKPGPPHGSACPRPHPAMASIWAASSIRTGRRPARRAGRTRYRPNLTPRGSRPGQRQFTPLAFPGTLSRYPEGVSARGSRLTPVGLVPGRGLLFGDGSLARPAYARRRPRHGRVSACLSIVSPIARRGPPTVGGTDRTWQPKRSEGWAGYSSVQVFPRVSGHLRMPACRYIPC